MPDLTELLVSRPAWSQSNRDHDLRIDTLCQVALIAEVPNRN